MIGTLLGGIGLFLLGMILMTDGLKVAAGDSLRHWLARLTGGAGKAMLSGMAITMLIQSSSATVVTIIGFVSAGLLTLTQAVGLIFGANLGTTSTGWIVSVIGLKISVSAVALPLVGVGALARFLLRGRVASLGLALAGFGVIFVGIDLMQQAMGSLESTIDLGRFPATTITARLGIVAVGAVMTVVLQSSSAAIATTLTAVHSGTLDLDQATMLVIGQNLGTTGSAALASLGASVPAKRTGMAHILFNVVAGVVAFALAPVFLYVVEDVRVIPGVDDPAVALAAFHTVFNLVGVLILLPVTSRFARLVTRLVPERGSPYTRHLDPTVAELPAVGIEAARRAVVSIAEAEIEIAGAVIGRMYARGPVVSLEPISGALSETRDFLRHLRTSPAVADEHRRHLAVLHAVDHLDRLDEALRDLPPRAVFGEGEDMPTVRHSVGQVLEEVGGWLRDDGPSPEARVETLSREVAQYRRSRRDEVLGLAASGEVEPGDALERLEGLRWLDRVVYHVWRSVHHLAAPGEAVADQATEVYAEREL